jgi:hypothetical protein
MGSQLRVHNERRAVGPLRAGFVRSARYLLSDCQQA